MAFRKIPEESFRGIIYLNNLGLARVQSPLLGAGTKRQPKVVFRPKKDSSGIVGESNRLQYY